VIEHQLSLQIHKLSIDCFIDIVTANYQKSVVYFLAKCIHNLQRNVSMIASQSIIHKLLTKVSFPMDPLGKNLPQTRQELIQCLDEELGIANQCLSSYIEFKRVSLTLIFDQFGS